MNFAATASSIGACVWRQGRGAPGAIWLAEANSTSRLVVQLGHQVETLSQSTVELSLFRVVNAIERTRAELAPSQPPSQLQLASSSSLAAPLH